MVMLQTVTVNLPHPLRVNIKCPHSLVEGNKVVANPLPHRPKDRSALKCLIKKAN